MLEAHINSNGHTINEHDPSHVMGSGVRYSSLFGEFGATHYLRQRFHPERSHNWSQNNPGVMDAFYDKHSIRCRATIVATKCNSAWIHESLVKEDA